MKKEEWLTGKEIMDKWSIKPFELLNWVRKGLVPYSPASLESYKIDPDGFMLISERRRSTSDEFDPNQHQYIRAWKFLFPYISDCIFRQKKVEEFEKRHPDLLKKKVTPPEGSDHKQLQESGIEINDLEEEKIIIELFKKVKRETEHIYNEVRKDFFADGITERDLKKRVVEIFKENENRFKLIKGNYLDLDLYYPSPNNTKRDFIAPLLKKIVKDQLGMKTGGQDLYRLYLKA